MLPNDHNSATALGRLAVGSAARPMPGETVSGDAWLVEQGVDWAVIAVIDGLGHGPDAHLAAMRAYAAMQTHVALAPTHMMQQAHQATLGTRGVVAAIFRFDYGARMVHFVGVGNIAVQVVSRPPFRPISRNGTVGYRLPPLFEQHAPLASGDLFVVCSDGIAPRFVGDKLLQAGLPPQTLADHLLQTYGKATDDATALIVQFQYP